MKNESRLTIAPVAVLVVLALLTILVVKHQRLTAEEAEIGAARAVVEVTNSLLKHKYAAVAFLVLLSLFAFVLWFVLRANARADKAMPPAKESSASGTGEVP